MAPWADERFVGYGGNKIAFINQLHGLGFGFHVHPYGFAIHVPHRKTRAADIFNIRKVRGIAEMDELRIRVESEVKRGTYVPAIENCPSSVESNEKETSQEEGKAMKRGDKTGKN